MTEYKYEVWCGGEQLAANMDLPNALILVEAYFDKYYNETDMDIKIVRIEK